MTSDSRIAALERENARLASRVEELERRARVPEDPSAEQVRLAHLIVENSPVVVFRWLPVEGWPVAMVTKNVELFGYSQEELLSGATPFAVMVHPDDLERVGREVQDYSAAGLQRFEQEYRMVTRDGRVRWVDDRSTVERHPDGRIAYYQGVVIDITERRVAEQACRESEERYRQLMRMSAAPIYLFDPGTKQVLEANPAFEALLGYSAEEIADLSAYDVIAHDRESIDRNVQAIMASGSLEIGERSWRRRDGTAVPVLVSSRRISTNGADAILITALDLTERKRQEEARLDIERRLLRGQKLEGLGVLAGGIAHDFNNLLLVILGNVSLALEEIALSSPARRLLGEASAASLRAADLCRQMLAYAGKGRVMDELLDLSAVVSALLPMLNVSTSKKAILKLDLGEDLPRVRGDATQMQQVVVNLVINASEAIGERPGLITVSTRAVWRGAGEILEGASGESVPAGRYVALEVSDDGCGMDPETQQRMFEPFFSTKFQGRGLGLSAVHGIVRGHGGTISIRSEPGKGTTILALLPVAEETATAAEERPGLTTVLLVDDEKAVRETCKRLLEKLGYRVLTASDGLEALALYRERGSEIGVVLLDMTMPRLNGEETLRELRQLDPRVRVLLSSGYDEQILASRFEGLGLAGILHKPYTPAELLRQLTAALGEPSRD